MIREMQIGVALVYALVATVAYAGPAALGPSSDFTGVRAPESSAAYFADGGWLVFSVPLVGDLLFACPALTSKEPRCQSVVLPIRGVSSAIERWYLDPDTGSAWFKISAPPMGEYLLACFDPHGAAYCNLVDIEERPPLAVLTRLDAEGAADSAGLLGALPIPVASGGGPSVLGSPDDEPCADSDGRDCNPSTFWMAAALVVPGPVNLYACGGLDTEPVCRLAVSGLSFIQAENFGLQKLSIGHPKGGDDGAVIGDAVVIGGVAAGSVAERAGLRDGDVVTSAAGFELLSAAHLRGLLSQVPVGDSIRLEVEGKGLVKLTRESRK
jgi:hypothetical protein